MYLWKHIMPNIVRITFYEISLLEWNILWILLGVGYYSLSTHYKINGKIEGILSHHEVIHTVILVIIKRCIKPNNNEALPKITKDV